MSQINRLQTIDADTLQSTAYEPVSFVVDDLLPQGLHLLAGAPKIGKSWLALWLCLCAAQGKPLWTFATRPCEVLYLCLEDSFQRIQSRLFDLTEDAPPTLHFAVMSQQLHNGLVEQIEQFLKEHPQTRLILLAYKRRKQMEADKQRRRLSPYLFTDEQGQLIHPDTFTKRLRKIYDAIGFPREYHLHTLRHYFVTSLLHCGVDKQTVADLVGHADTGFLERTYCHPQQAQKEQAADSMLTMLRPDGEQIFNLAAACSPKQHSA